MPDFMPLFVQAKGQPVVYEGKTIMLSDRFLILDAKTLKLTFEQVGSEWRQGLNLRCNGTIECNNQMIKKFARLWQDTAPKEVTFAVQSADGVLLVNNVWETGNGCVHAWHGGAAMMREEIPSGCRYFCNDGHPDEDFRDLVFKLERMT